MRIDDGFYNNPDNGVDYSDNKNIIGIDEAYDSMFTPTKRRYNGHILAACMRKARAVFDNFPIAVLWEWNQQADQLNQIPVSGHFVNEPPSVILGDLSTLYTDHLFTVIFELVAKLVVHVPLAVQLNELFTVQGLSATNYLAGNRSQYQYIGCSKVIIITEDNDEVDTYIVDSDDTVWTLHCTGNIELKKMPPLQRDGNNCIITNETYIYNNIEFSVLEYHPIRLVIYKNISEKRILSI